MAMMNSEARKRATGTRDEPAQDPLTLAERLAESWDREAAHEDACGNGIAAVILHAHARALREVLTRPLSA